jgi:hemoglobin
MGAIKHISKGEKYGKGRINKMVNLALTGIYIVFLGLGLYGCSHQTPVASTPEPSKPTLYERVGGANNIAMLIDDVIERSYVDEVLNANPYIRESHKRFPKAIYKFNATALACQGMGGPQKYTGRTLKDSHKHLYITEKEWNALIAIFRDSMNSFKVPEDLQSEVIELIESTKSEIISLPLSNDG